jgi:hypothetical protein
MDGVIMNSEALDRLTMIHGTHLENVIGIINEMATPEKSLLMMRLFIVSLVAFWEAFHEKLCREVLIHNQNISAEAEKQILYFNNPDPDKIDKLYNNVLGIANITEEAWWGDPFQKTGITSVEFRETIKHMVKLRHDIAHGEWQLPLSANDCQNFLSAVIHLAVRTEEVVDAHFQISR